MSAVVLARLKKIPAKRGHPRRGSTKKHGGRVTLRPTSMPITLRQSGHDCRSGTRRFRTEYSQEMRVRGVEHTGHINASRTFISDQTRSSSKRGYPRHFAHRGLASRAQKRVGACASRLVQHRSYLSLGRFGRASFIGTNVNVPPCSSAMTTASAPSGLPDLIASAHSSRADNNACRRAACAVGSSVPS